MKKKLIVLLMSILIVLFFFFLFFMRKENEFSLSNLTKKLSKTETILVNKLIFGDGHSASKEMTNLDDINEVIKIISSGTQMEQNEIVPYSGPKYRFTMLNKRKKLIAEVEFYFYTTDDDKNFGWISFGNNSPSYKIDVDSLLKIIIC